MLPGLRDFLYEGDPGWKKRRWLLFWSLTFTFMFMVAAAVSVSSAWMPIDLGQTIITSGFALITILLPGYLFSATWDDKNKREAGASVSETVTTTVDTGPPATRTETVQTEVRPAEPAREPTPPPGAEG